MTTKFDARKIKIDMYLLNEAKIFAQQIKRIEPIMKFSFDEDN